MSSDPIDRYLDELFVELRRSPASDARSLLAEAEGHLRDTADALVAGGMRADDAQRAAVERFGAVAAIVRQDRHRSSVDLVRRVLVSGWWMGALGALATGFSGAVAAVMRLAGASNAFIAGNQPSANPAATDCARWLSLSPRARSCAQAALSDWAAETVGYRLAAGVLGACALAVAIIVRRRDRLARWQLLPATVTDSIGACLFGAAGIWLTGLGVDALR